MGIEKKSRGEQPFAPTKRLPPIAYMLLIFYMSSKPAPEGILPELWNIDKVIHFIEYGILGVLWFRALKTSGVNTGRIAIIAFVITFLYGISDEIHQYFVPERSCGIFDVIADGAGGWAGIWFYRKL